MTWWVWGLVAVPGAGLLLAVVLWLALSLQGMREGLEEEP